MVTQHSSSALRAPASSRPYPMAKPGYGKHSAPGQLPHHTHDFAFLPDRERYVAGFIDRLPDGAAMDVKTLAKQLPLHGQQAVGSALRALAAAGHLRRVRCLISVAGQFRWVFRTFWSRTARDNEWWATTAMSGDSGLGGAVAAGETAGDGSGDSSGAGDDTPEALTPPRPAESHRPAPAVPPTPSEPVTRVTPVTPSEPVTPAPPALPQQRATEPGQCSPAYLALAQLGRIDSRLTLSAADCSVLEGRAAEWLARGVSTEYLTQALTAGLPPRVDSPVGFVRCRLTGKIPPRVPTPPAPPAPAVPVHRMMMECTECGTPGHPDALPDGLCRPCRTPAQESAPGPAAGLPSERDVRAFAAELRVLLKSP